MKKTEAIGYFDSQRDLASALGVHEQSIQRWPDEVPERWVTGIRNAMVMRASLLEKQAAELRQAAGI